MKTNFLKYMILMALTLISVTSWADGICPGACINQGHDSFYDALCKAAGEAHGQNGCTRYSQFGCAYFQTQPVVLPGRCVNQGGDSNYNQLCLSAGQARGQQQCEKYAQFGCTWYSSQVVCR